ncbi:hypothetical protein G6F57_009894 [Rhizopus arrhizus]|nr:hypothetical protein G6F19_004372 [Rhizopus arrhizus]KAG0867318.1 hypothetical protein G6F16_008857 [Rhizopus arrhizus]KAG0876034.1 hypothetical protein G6F15_010198 [Rhizopus arrhizus]KAG0903569.1 hypothetical protein G6F34_001003 [Rhizopus arrhizus]KAG0933113.1 hypothetical protein G6F30_010423 [Rhizopus arrhizus]
MSTLLCRVKANYAFESNDPSSLSFKEGDYIDVLCKLPSGWWDGWCDGQRGWFPSDYVEIVEEYGCTEINNNNTTLQIEHNSTNDYELTPDNYFSNKEKLPLYTTIEHQTEHGIDTTIDQDLNYKKLLVDITLAIHNLVSAARNSESAVFVQHVTHIVHTIRCMMISTSTISKDTSIIKSNNILKVHHKLMMNSLSKLIFSSQLKDITRILAESKELLMAVRNFMHLCENMNIQLHHADPVLISSLSPEYECKTHPSAYQLTQDWVDLLDSCGDCMQHVLKSLITHLSRPAKSRTSLTVLLFTQYRHLAAQNEQFLSLIENADFQYVAQSHLMKDLTFSKQNLHAGFGLLFIKLQILTDESKSEESVLDEIQKAAQSILEAIQTICKIMTDIVNEQGDANLTSGTNKRNLLKWTLSDSTSASSHSSLPNVNNNDIPSPPIVHRHSILHGLFKESSLDTLDNHRLSLDASSTSIHPAQSALFKTNSNQSDTPLSPVSPTEESSKRNSFIVTESSQGSQITTVDDSDDKCSFLQYDYEPNDILFTEDGHVKGGTLPALVERLTLHDYFDMNFNITFFLTYRSFSTSEQILSLLKSRFNLQPPKGLTEDELNLWKNKKLKLVRLRVFNVIKIWLEQYYCEKDYAILDKLLEFTNSTIRNCHSFSANQLVRLIQKRKGSCKDIKSLVATQPADTPEPILPRNLNNFKLLDISAVEMARQLTLIDFRLFNAIQPLECLDKAWSREDSYAIHIQQSIQFCNLMTQWVSDAILSQPEVKKRCALLKYWIHVAERCRQWNNFNTCMAIVSAFDNSAVGRLKRTWEIVGARAQHVVAHLRTLMKASRNFAHYRELIHSINPPCVPFVGIYLQDLTFIEDGNSNFLKPPHHHLINFAKRTKTAAVIQEIQQYQMVSYSFRPVEQIQDFIWHNLQNSRDEDQLYKESLRLEPKEREDEKITRLLQESGFL